MLELQQVSKSYAKGHAALQDISFGLDDGEMAFLTGHSGAGKSTLLKLIGLFERCSKGQIKLAGHNINKLSRRKALAVRRNMGIIFQQPYLLQDQNVFANAALPLVIAGQSVKANADAVYEALDAVGLDGFAAAMPADLSAGELQRLSIARAVVRRPQLLLADEPTGNLDPALALDIMRLFEKLNQDGMTILVASHDLALIARLKHRVITLAKGKLVNDGKHNQRANHE